MTQKSVARPNGLLELEWQETDGKAWVRDADAYDPNENVVKHAMLVWDPVGLAWVKFTGGGGSGGGGGGPATIADGADVAEGHTTDAAWDGAAAAATGVSLWKYIGLKLEAVRALLAGTLTVGLPAGASTATKQDTGNTSVASIDTKTPALMAAAPASDTGQSAIPVRVISQLGAGTGGGGGGAVTIADGADVTQGAKADAAWDGAAASPTAQAILKYVGAKIEAVRALLAGTLTVGGSVAVSNFPATQPVSLAVNAPDVTDRAARLLGHVTVDSSALPTGAALDATLTGGTQKAIALGDVASGVADSGNPVKVGGLAKTGLPTAVADGQRVAGLMDLYGRRRVLAERPKLLGAYKFESGRLTILASAHASTAGFFWLINPVGSTVLCYVKKVLATSVPTAVTAFASSPRVTVERMTFTGTPSGATITPAKRDSNDATNVCSIRTASTGLTPVAGAPFCDFIVPAVLTAAGIAVPWDQYLYDDTDEDDYIVLRAGEGLIFRQADAGTTSDTRLLTMYGSWEER